MTRKQGQALVVGAGIAGMRAAMDLAESGYGVTMIDRAPHMGGILSRLDHQFPTDGCGMCRMLPHIDRDSAAQRCLRKGLSHENIDIRLQAGISSIDGEAGNFRVVLKQSSNPVDPNLCIGCGECVAVCPAETPDPFNMDGGTRKAIGLPSPHMAPGPYMIDIESCTQCGKCSEVCPTGAISMPVEDRGAFCVLVVDDERVIRDSLKEWLSLEGGFTVLTAESGHAALEILNTRPVHLMLVDVKMPGMDGVAVLEKTRALFPDLPVMMITAYATVDTAVNAMKIGALDYLVKPFDPGELVGRVIRIFREQMLPPGPELTVGAIVLAGGSELYDPRSGLNPFGYKDYADVVTAPEFERFLSGTGPTGGKLFRPSDGRPVLRIAWIQCVGSRNIVEGADFCSGICCMYALKQARLAMEYAGRLGEAMEATVYYIDMRTFGKPYQTYRDRTEAMGVRLVRGRVHSLFPDEEKGALSLRVADGDGRIHPDLHDLVVLSVGQRPSAGMADLAEMLDLRRDSYGFIETEPFSLTRTSNNGVFAAGAATGFKDIHEAVICGSAAACSASSVMHAAGETSDLEADIPEPFTDVSGQPIDTLIAVCECMGTIPAILDTQELARRVKQDPAVGNVIMTDRLCSPEGWDALAETIREKQPNRVVVGGCRPLMQNNSSRELEKSVHLFTGLVEVTDIRSLFPAVPGESGPETVEAIGRSVLRQLEMSLTRVKRSNPAPDFTGTTVKPSALVVGGGIAGMTAALAIADHGHEVHLVEKAEHLGGNLTWLSHTLEGNDIAGLLDQTIGRIEDHPLVHVHTNARVTESAGQAGDFVSTVKIGDDEIIHLGHGATLWATGGVPGQTDAYGYGSSRRILTQKEFEIRMSSQDFDPDEFGSVLMILCADTRQPPKNYCSRTCCATALKHALFMKEQQPDAAIYIFYRDMMTYGLLESYYTRARKAGVVFIPYTPESKPRVSTDGDRITVIAREPIIGRNIEIDADMMVLATGVVPSLSKETAAASGISLDDNGFFEEAEYKWRPVEANTEGVFGCGLAESPGSITESIASAEAAAIRAIRLLSRTELPAGRVTAQVRHSLCSLCERCISACPYGARTYDADSGRIVVHAAICQGCGACAAACPNSAAYVEGFRQGQMLDMIDEVI